MQCFAQINLSDFMIKSDKINFCQDKMQRWNLLSPYWPIILTFLVSYLDKFIITYKAIESQCEHSIAI